ncbi:MAG: Ohr family peroxiredoxin [Massilia sp.]
MPTKIQTVLLTGRSHTMYSGGPEKVDMLLSTPDNSGKNIEFKAVQMHPTAEQLFAGAWSACYIAALAFVGKAMKVKLPADLAVDIEVDLGKIGDAYQLQARFYVSMPGLESEVAQSIAHAAHDMCPYSKAVKGNIDVDMEVQVA